jgi:hypothetical protein
MLDFRFWIVRTAVRGPALSDSLYRRNRERDVEMRRGECVYLSEIDGEWSWPRSANTLAFTEPDTAGCAGEVERGSEEIRLDWGQTA